MKLFVTGGTSFIGAYFLKAALRAGHEISALRRESSKPVIPVAESSVLRWIDGSLENVEAGQLSGHDALLHFASYGVSPQPCTWDQAFKVNVTDSIALLERALDAGIPRIILCGTCMEYGASAEKNEAILPTAPLEPIGPYAASKEAISVASSALCREKKFQLAILRLFTVYGEGQHPDNFWPSLRRAAVAGADFEMTAGEQIRDFTPVGQVAEDFLKALEIPLKAGEPLLRNVGSGHPQQLRDFARFWWDKLGATGQLRLGSIPYRPHEIMRYVPVLSE